VFIKALGVYIHVIDVDECTFPAKVAENHIHQPLKGVRGVTKSKGHGFKLEEPFSANKGFFSLALSVKGSRVPAKNLRQDLGRKISWLLPVG
jgi:hypothetical protein